jgi:polysaccharide export outer membrane protein
MEDVRGVDPALLEGAQTTQDGKVPVIYRLNMSSPISFFVAQGFQMRNKDILYVSNAPAADLQKFVGIVSQMAFSVISIGNAVN